MASLGGFAIIHRLRRFQSCLFSAPEILIPRVYGTKNRRRKPAFLERVSWVLEMLRTASKIRIEIFLRKSQVTNLRKILGKC